MNYCKTYYFFVAVGRWETSWKADENGAQDNVPICNSCLL